MASDTGFCHGITRVIMNPIVDHQTQTPDPIITPGPIMKTQSTQTETDTQTPTTVNKITMGTQTELIINGKTINCKVPVDQPDVLQITEQSTPTSPMGPEEAITVDSENDCSVTEDSDMPPQVSPTSQTEDEEINQVPQNNDVVVSNDNEKIHPWTFSPISTDEYPDPPVLTRYDTNDTQGGIIPTNEAAPQTHITELIRSLRHICSKMKNQPTSPQPSTSTAGVDNSHEECEDIVLTLNEHIGETDTQSSPKSEEQPDNRYDPFKVRPLTEDQKKTIQRAPWVKIKPQLKDCLIGGMENTSNGNSTPTATVLPQTNTTQTVPIDTQTNRTTTVEEPIDLTRTSYAVPEYYNRTSTYTADIHTSELPAHRQNRTRRAECNYKGPNTKKSKPSK